MKMETEFWAAHVAAAKLEAISASEYEGYNKLAKTVGIEQWHRTIHMAALCAGASAGSKNCGKRSTTPNLVA